MNKEPAVSLSWDVAAEAVDETHRDLHKMTLVCLAAL